VNSMLDRYPDYYKNSPEFVELIGVLEAEILALWEAYAFFFDNVVLQRQNPAYNGFENTGV